ncbi:putative CRISPR-associated endonuclease Cas2 [Leptospira inadai serovar Lyme str. 10]|nr:putative CRISPR-associated endonuclease Cas2 [Leptospira inadai serovar Lyme str. 10]
MLKLCRKYLNWIQNSVFEGEITPARLEKLKMEAKKIMKSAEDSIILFLSRNEKWLEKEIIGVEKMPIDNIL